MKNNNIFKQAFCVYDIHKQAFSYKSTYFVKNPNYLEQFLTSAVTADVSDESKVSEVQ